MTGTDHGRNLLAKEMQFRINAEHCRIEAERAETKAARAEFSDLAKRWDDIANEAEDLDRLWRGAPARDAVHKSARPAAKPHHDRGQAVHHLAWPKRA